MGWNIDVVTNELKLTKKQATQLVDILEKTWSEYSTYTDWVGEKPEIIRFFTGELEFIEDFSEHRDYLGDEEMQAALLAVGAEGCVTFADFEGDTRGHAWTHTFKDGKYTYAFGRVKQMVDGRIPDSLVKVPQIEWETVGTLTSAAPFESNAFVVTGEMSTISRRNIEDAISNMGGRTHAPLSGKTYALIAGTEAGPAKLAKAAKIGTTVWDEETFLVMAGLKEAPVAAVAVGIVVPESTKVPYGWHFDEYHVETGEVVRDGFSRVDITDLKSKVKGFAYRFTPLFTA